jgi:methionyl-tRNA formyltransferase
MNAQALHDALAEAGSSLLIKTLKQIEAGTLVREKQDDSASCYAPMMNKEISKIDWQMTSTEIRNRIRAFNPWPIAHTTLGDNPLKVFEASIIDLDEALAWQNSQARVGTIVHSDKNGIYVKTGDGYIRIDVLQWGSHKRMSTQAFLLGNDVAIGTELK